MLRVKYLNRANASPMIRKLEDTYLKLIEFLEDTQKVYGNMYNNLIVVNGFVLNLDEASPRLKQLKTLHGSSVDELKVKLRDLFAVSSRMINCVEDELKDVFKLDTRRRQILESGAVLNANVLDLKHKVYSDNEAKSLIHSLL